jgi:hypothetical protein
MEEIHPLSVGTQRLLQQLCPEFDAALARWDDVAAGNSPPPKVEPRTPLGELRRTKQGFLDQLKQFAELNQDALGNLNRIVERGRLQSTFDQWRDSDQFIKRGYFTIRCKLCGGEFSLDEDPKSQIQESQTSKICSCMVGINRQAAPQIAYPLRDRPNPADSTVGTLSKLSSPRTSPEGPLCATQ